MSVPRSADGAARTMQRLGDAARAACLPAGGSTRRKAPYHACGNRSRFAAGQLPAFIIISADKTGSTGIFMDLVTGHHSISDQVVCKETGFFNSGCGRTEQAIGAGNRSCTAATQAREADEYKPYFAACPSLLSGEASPGYFASLCAASRIRCTLPRVRLMLFTRDPVARFLSRLVGNFEHNSRSEAWLTFAAHISAHSAANGGDPIVRGRYAHILHTVWSPHFDISGADGSLLVLPSE